MTSSSPPPERKGRSHEPTEEAVALRGGTRRVVAWSTRDRTAYLDIFHTLALDGVPELKRRRDLILEEAARAPGGQGIAILPRLDEMVRSLWKEVEAAALRHGVSCREPSA